MTATGVDRPRDGKGKWIQGQDSIERDAEAFRLRSRGWTFQRISEHLGYGSDANVHRAVKKHVAGRVAPSVDELRQTMDAQLDHLYEKALEVLEGSNLKFHQGVVVTLEGEPVQDPGPYLAAVKTLLDVQERRAKLWGTDAPQRQEVEVTTVKFSIEGAEDV